MQNYFNQVKAVGRSVAVKYKKHLNFQTEENYFIKLESQHCHLSSIPFLTFFIFERLKASTCMHGTVVLSVNTILS